jgi:transcriptional regulator with XRE-family HTH domain
LGLVTPNGPALRVIRRLRGHSLRQFARLIGKDPGFWSRVETSQQGASDDALHRAANVLDVPIEAITREPADERPDQDHQ